MTEFKIILFVIEEDFSKSRSIEIRLYVENYEDIEEYLKETIKKDYSITQIEKI